MGKLVAEKIDLEIEVSDAQADARAPGFGWTLSKETADTLRDIDANIRAAEQLSGSLLLG